MGRQGHDTSAAAPGMRIQRSQSKMSLSASFEALAIYFPCMNSFDEEDGGKMTAGNGGGGLGENSDRDSGFPANAKLDFVSVIVSDLSLRCVCVCV